MEKRKTYEWADPPGKTAFPIARPGYQFIFGSAFITLVMALLGFICPALAFLGITFCICMFFRDPDRLIPKDPDALVSPADGRVIRVERTDQNRFIQGPCIKISIFMSVANVHVNRAPFSGTVEQVIYHPGGFSVASLDKASEENEHNAVVLKTESGHVICFVQIAGFVARRILCRLTPGDTITKGERYGMICFGSRLDCFFPAQTVPAVRVGDRVRSGTSILGRIS